MRLSANFTLAELCHSATAVDLGIDNSVTDPAVIAALTALAIRILQPARDHFAVPFSPSSGYRCRALNRALGSKDTSQHTRGQAADFTVPGVANQAVAAWIRDTLIFDQLILESYDLADPAAGWIHCSYAVPLRHEVLRTADGRHFDVGLPTLP